MIYFYTKYKELPKIEIYFELDEEGYATRQINIEEDNVKISCLDDCLAEMNCFQHFQEVILDREKSDNEKLFTYDDLINHKDILENNGTVFITKKDFEEQWINYTKPHREQWEKHKDGLENGFLISGTIKYFYPMGTIIKYGIFYGVLKGDINANIGDKVFCKVIGSDDVNMWLELAISDVALTVVLYKKYNQPLMIQPNLNDNFNKYLKKSNIELKEGQMFIYGWVEHDFSVKDVLITKNNSKLIIETFTPLYGTVLDYVYRGIRHGIICNEVDEEFAMGEQIRLLNL